MFESSLPHSLPTTTRAGRISTPRRAARRFAEWCELREIPGLADVQPIHISAYLRALQQNLSAPTVKLRMLFDWFVLGHVLDVNPAHAVRGPKHSARKGKTPVLATDEARALLDRHRRHPESPPRGRGARRSGP